jgi:hypothetical protein
MARQSQSRPAQTTAKRPVEPPPNEAIAEAELEVLGDLPAVALADSYLSNSQALGLAALNAVAEQQKTAIMAMSATMSGVAKILSLDPPSLADAPTTPPADTTRNQKEP